MSDISIVNPLRVSKPVKELSLPVCSKIETSEVSQISVNTENAIRLNHSSEARKTR